MAEPTYPVSTARGPTDKVAFQDINEVRTDALYLNALPADAELLGDFIGRYSQWIDLEYLATNLIRITYNNLRPPTLMINGYMLKAAANVDAPSVPTGGSGTKHIRAIRTAGSKTFTITIDNNSGAEGVDERTIGKFFWNGSNIDVSSIESYQNQYIQAQQKCIAWGYVDQFGGVNDSFGIQSVAHAVTGIYAITLKNAMNLAFYAVAANADNTTNFHAAVNALAVGSFNVRVFNTANALTDNAFTFVVFGAR